MGWISVTINRNRNIADESEAFMCRTSGCHGNVGIHGHMCHRCGLCLCLTSVIDIQQKLSHWSTSQQRRHTTQRQQAVGQSLT